MASSPQPSFLPRRRNATLRRPRLGAPLTETTDVTLAALMTAAQAGDARAYQALLRACVPIATATARRTGVPADRIEDVVQDILLTIHRARASYDPARPFLPWLRAIAGRRAIDALRRRYRQAATEVQDEDATLAAADPATAADEALSRAAETRLLQEAVALLPPGQRQAVELLALQERSLEEASGDTGRTKVALKVNLHRAIHALRKQLANGADAGTTDV